MRKPAYLAALTFVACLPVPPTPGIQTTGDAGTATDAPSPVSDFDRDVVPDAIDQDGDNDGIPNEFENVLGVDPLTDEDVDGIPNYLDPEFPSTVCTDLDRNAVCDAIAPYWDADQDGTPNHLDRDSDNDGSLDSVESGLNLDRDADGIADCTFDPNGRCPLTDYPALLPFRTGGLPGFLNEEATTPNEAILGTYPGESGGSFLRVPFRNQAASAQIPTFTDVQKILVGIFPREVEPGIPEHEFDDYVAGISAVDIDGDDRIDFAITRMGNALGSGKEAVYQNMVIYKNNGGDFSRVLFTDVVTPHPTAPLFIDANSDESLDMLVGALNPVQAYYGFGILNKFGVFLKIDTPYLDPVFSLSAADTNRDGLLDVMATHGRREGIRLPTFLLRNTPKGFVNDDVSKWAPSDTTFSAQFADLDLDDWPDLAITGFFGGTTLLRGSEKGFSAAATPSSLGDQNTTSQMFADYDNDGDLDWFTSGIAVANRADFPAALVGQVGTTGNRLFRNNGARTFADVTDDVLRMGSWGWGTCAADLNLDGFLDIVQVNGMDTKGLRETVFAKDQTRVWLNQGQMKFLEVSKEANLVENANGRGLACFDYNGDGSIDILTATNKGTPNLWKNTLKGNWLSVSLGQTGQNRNAVGAKIIVVSPNLTQFREVTAGSSYQSQQPYQQHFGLGPDTTAKVIVRWPDGSGTVQTIATMNRTVRMQR